MAVEGLAMIRRIVTDPARSNPVRTRSPMIIRAVDQPPLSTMIDIIRHEVDPGYSMWAPRYDGPNPAIETEEPVFTELVRGIASRESRSTPRAEPDAIPRSCRRWAGR